MIIDNKEITANDFTITVKNIPVDKAKKPEENETELRDFFHSFGQF